MYAHKNVRQNLAVHVSHSVLQEYTKPFKAKSSQPILLTVFIARLASGNVPLIISDGPYLKAAADQGINACKIYAHKKTALFEGYKKNSPNSATTTLSYFSFFCCCSFFSRWIASYTSLRCTDIF